MRGLPPIPVIGKEQLPYTPKRPRRIQRAPRAFAFPEEGQHYGGPGETPLDFVGAKNSATEWYPFWGLAEIFGQPSPRALRHAPYVGVPDIWLYQDYIPGGLLTTNIDFVVLPTNGLAQPTAFRIQTERVHGLPAEHDKYASDIFYRNNLEAGYEVVDIWDFMFLGDPTGQAIIQLLKAGMGLIEAPNPVLTGQFHRVPT